MRRRDPNRPSFPLLLPFLLPLLLWAAGCAPIETATVVDTVPAAVEDAAAGAAPAEAPAADAPATETSADAPALDAEIPLAPEVKIGRLENGLTYYIRANRRPEERAELRLLVDAGSVLEDEDQLGLAHFVEHMAFNGTRRFAKQELVDYLESIGIRFGADLNAYTSFDETVYMLTVPTDDAEILERGFEVLADWAAGVSFEGEEIDKERGVLIEEWRLGRGAGARLRDRQLPIIFRGSRYAERLPIGEVEILQNAPHDALKRFYRDWYRPDLMAVVAVGDFDPERIEELIRRNFEPIPAVEAPRQRPIFPMPGHPETLFALASDPELSNTSVAVLYKHPAQSQGTYGDYRRALVESLYHSMLNARLAELSQEAEPPFLYAASGAGSFVRSASVFSLQAAVREGEVERGLEALLAEVERVDRHGFTASELERAKTNLERSYEQAFRERDKLESGPLASEAGRNFLEGEPIPGIAAELELVERFLPTIELDEVNRLARQWITEENRVITVSAPEKDEVPLPTEDEILAVFDAVEARQLEPYVDEVRDAPLLADAPEPGEIVEERAIEEIGVTEWRLSNGARVVMKPTDFKNDQVLLAAVSPGGHSLVDDADVASAQLATTILSESGLGEFSQIELGKALAGKVASAQAYLGELEEGVNGFASPQDLETMFQLVHLRFTAPRLDREAYESLMAKLRILVENRLSQPGTVFSDRLSEVLSQGHPRRRPFSPELLAEVDPERALEIYRERFADASDFVFLLVGNFEPEALRPLVETYLASLPASGREESFRDVGVEPPTEVVEFEVRKGLEPKSQVSLVFTGDAEWSRERQHEISTLARVLDIRLREALREDRGATYGVGVSGSLSPRPSGEYRFSISFGCDPEQVDELVAAVFEEIERFQSEGGIESKNLEKVQEIQRRARETDLRENSFWMQALETYITLDLDPRLLLDYEELVAGVDLEDLRQAARRYLDRDRYVLGVLYPEVETAAAAAGG